MTKKVIVMLGAMKSGKTTYANEIIKNDKTFMKISFADALREEAWEILGYKPDNYDNFKKRIIYLDKCPDFISKILSISFPFLNSGRQFLQNLGEKRRKKNPKYWIEKVGKKIKNDARNIVIDDCRYKNELLYVYNICKKNNYELKVYFCNWHEQVLSFHDSERLARYLSSENALFHREYLGGLNTVVAKDGVHYSEDYPNLKKDILGNIFNKYDGK